MKKIKWLVEKGAFLDIATDRIAPVDCGVKRLMAEVENQGMECIEAEYWEFDDKTYDKYGQHDECIVSYTGLGLAKRIRNTCAWTPGIYCNLPNFKCSKYFAYYYKYLLNQSYVMMPIPQLIDSIDMVRDMLSFSETFSPESFFIRPDRGDKPFAGIVLRHDEINLDNLGNGYYYDEKDILVLVSVAIPKGMLEKEWRFFVTKDKVLTGSQYMIDAELEVSPDMEQGAWDYAQKILDEVDWYPDPIFVMDICKMDDEYYLLELNAASTSGLYDCDVKPIVKAMSELAYNEWSEIYGQSN